MMFSGDSHMMGFDLVMTCGACPEQYDVFRDGSRVGYLRLRHGHFSAEYEDCGGPLVYEAETVGDGVFDDSERELHIGNALLAISHHIKARVET